MPNGERLRRDTSFAMCTLSLRSSTRRVRLVFLQSCVQERFKPQGIACVVVSKFSGCILVVR